MPYEIRKSGSQFCVVKKATGKKMGCHPTKEKARAQMSALYVNETDKAVAFGGQVKALEGGLGLVGGYAVLFSDASSPDLQGEFFTKDTDFFVDDETRLHVLYHHGMDKSLRGRRLGKATVKVDDVGVWVEAQLALRDDYEKAIYDMVRKNKLGWSTGSAGNPFLAEKALVKDGGVTAMQIKAWPLFETSLTPMPIEPRTMVMDLKAYVKEVEDLEDGDMTRVDPAVAALEERRKKRKKGKARENYDGSTNASKALSDRLTQHLADLVDDGGDRVLIVKAMADEAIVDTSEVEQVLAGDLRPSTPLLKGIARALGLDFDLLKDLNTPDPVERGIKGLFEDELYERDHHAWELWSALSCVVHKIASAAAASGVSGVKFDADEKIDEALDEYLVCLAETIKHQVSEYVDKGDIHTEFYLRALGDPREADFVSAKSVSAEDHAALAVSAFTSVLSRVVANGTNRMKAGRKMSSKHYKMFKDHMNEMGTLVQRGHELVDQFKPEESATGKAAEMRVLRDNHRLTTSMFDLDTADLGV